jgi:hypothetical protein
MDGTTSATTEAAATAEAVVAVDTESETVFVQSIQLGDQCHSDATGRFPHESSTGMKYLLVSVYDGYIKFNALHDRTSGDYTRAYGDLLDFFAERKKKVTVIKLDNEKSAEVEDMFRLRDTEYAYVPPGNHRTLKAERAIRAAKNHILAMLCTADDEFPMYLWDKVLPQAELTINHLRECKSNPAVSAYEGMFNKKYDFDAHPIAPVGIKVIVHDKPDNRASWDPHGVEGFYLGPALDHYRCWRAWIKSTRSVRVSDTMAWFPARVKMPGASPIDMLSAAVKDVSVALTRVADNEAVSQHRQPYDTLQATAVSALQDIARMLNPNAPFANPPRMLQNQSSRWHPFRGCQRKSHQVSVWGHHLWSSGATVNPAEHGWRVRPTRSPGQRSTMTSLYATVKTTDRTVGSQANANTGGTYFRGCL